MKVVIEAYDKKTELLVSEREIQDKFLAEVMHNIGFSSEDESFLCSGFGGFNLTEEQVKIIEAIIDESIYSENYDFQLGTA
ncbi:DUF7683 domain-containing protein [Vibrio spartinae]|uniref:DUF7683 domain-containing protein n=1 Tax=Vibrio spartinae TaxID=1918945 RepID=A0ABX6R569_9VIBR|nr:hypothetical protein [Vibrio spartinae]QMV16694.1 hypothetical protein Vspart_04095 [Vibrio spartinae]